MQMAAETKPRTLGRLEAVLLRRLAEEQRTTLSVQQDRQLLQSITSAYANLLSRMSDKGVLIPLGGGRYVVSSWAGDSLAQAAPFNVLLDATLRPYGDYYLGFLSAVIEHRLTDEDSWEVYVALREDATFKGKQLVIDRRPVIVTRITGAHRWVGLERTRATRREYYWRSTLERTLIDTLYRPRLSGDIELIAGAWVRAAQRPDLDLTALCGYARAVSVAVARRTGYMLSRLGHRDAAVEHLGDLRGRRNQVLLDSASSYGKGAWPRNAEWGITINVPERSLAGWLAQ
jgi:predicted transcriptional regulator of viral defense system